jgi:putative hydrolase of the HAD superfamily
MGEIRARLGPRKAFLFDLFHTLTGDEPSWSELPSTSGFLGIDGDLWNRLLEESSPDRLCGRERDPFRILRSLADQARPGIPDERVRQAVGLRTERFRRGLLGVPAANVAVLRRLRAEGLALGLVSNADVMEAAAFGDCPLAGAFDAVTFSCDAGCAKPDRRIYGRTLQALGVEPEEAVFVGDGGSSELRGARELGLATVLMTGVIRGMWPERIGALRTWADHEIASLEELL